MSLPPWSECPGVTADIFMLGGGAVIKGSREPVARLIDWVQSGNSADEYLESFVVDREPVAAVVDWLVDVLRDVPEAERDRATLIEWQAALGKLAREAGR